MIETMMVVIIPCPIAYREQPSFAERLLDLGNEALGMEGLLDPTDLPETSVWIVNLALRFAQRPAGFRLRALVEGWDRERLVREMY